MCALLVVFLAATGLVGTSAASAAAPGASHGPQVRAPRILSAKLMPDGTVAVRLSLTCTVYEPHNFTVLEVFVDQGTESGWNHPPVPFPCAGRRQVVVVPVDGSALYVPGPAQIYVAQLGSCDHFEDDDGELTSLGCDTRQGDRSFYLDRNVVLK